MGKRQKEWARKTRDKILLLLGEHCNKCSSTVELEFDVIIPTGDVDENGKEKHHRMYDWSHRMSFYRKQLENNNLQVLCSKCNARKQNRLELDSNLKQSPEQPF